MARTRGEGEDLEGRVGDAAPGPRQLGGAPDDVERLRADGPRGAEDHQTAGSLTGGAVEVGGHGCGGHGTSMARPSDPAFTAQGPGAPEIRPSHREVSSRPWTDDKGATRG